MNLSTSGIICLLGNVSVIYLSIIACRVEICCFLSGAKCSMHVFLSKPQIMGYRIQCIS